MLADPRLDQREPHGDRARDRAATHLVGTDHELHAVAVQRMLDAQGGIGDGHSRSTPWKVTG
jgi:hypothetical protein